MEIRRYVMGAIETNSYILVEGNECILIDPAGKGSKVIDLIGDLKPVAVLLTHGHFDHIKACDELYAKYKLPVYLHHDDESLARDKNQGHLFNMYIYLSCPTKDIEEGITKIGNFEFETFFTPGHTPGSVIYKFGKEIFTGDTLFRMSVGRTDLDGGNERDLMSSLRIFKEFDSDCYIYPGHGSISTIGFELENNPFL